MATVYLYYIGIILNLIDNETAATSIAGECFANVKKLVTGVLLHDNPYVHKSKVAQAAIRGCKFHTGKCICRFAGIYAYCRYSIDRKW